MKLFYLNVLGSQLLDEIKPIIDGEGHIMIQIFFVKKKLKLIY
jgi:hypothetical protein